MKGCNFAFNLVQLLYYKCHKTNLNRGEPFIDSPDSIKQEKVTGNPINKKENRCFQYPETVVLNYEETIEDPQRSTKIKSFINKYNWKGINAPSAKGD